MSMAVRGVLGAVMGSSLLMVWCSQLDADPAVSETGPTVMAASSV